MKNKNSKKKPFFASFLEKQLQDPDKIKGGGEITDIRLDNVETSKTGDIVTKPIYDLAQTMKYPSDGDEDATLI
ncbi:microviridin/marinostatin family tricyclic proteinase inhibitor [Chryseobacterium salviniae]|uniref:Microviridin/marinostatin family tricyclic proteinase inhibitor n=1 Tax=Chryseobacterium salviniae TaxID=3101750 RepID=A0ABU6HS65_9FLAO|nr:microviridin/marinostatin family tricyclic proteinase inhibitor [Chryseobacterium sp. T9W2-O]MEC3875904.1 microviridin/marinostatin family tricyclic proteinase inhibitor [Chryseobacterium sp. T9W2-O]